MLGILILLSSFLFINACEKEPVDESSEIIETQIDIRVKDCKWETLKKICATGKSEAEAKANLGAKARFNCMGTCLGKDCNTDRTCLLKKVELASKVTTKLIPAEFPHEMDMWEACADFHCKCKCGRCNGNKQVGVTFTAKHIDPVQAFAMASNMAKEWCASTGCPGIAGCKNNLKCESTGAGKIQKISESRSPMLPFETTVTVLLTECTCKCKK